MTSPRPLLLLVHGRPASGKSTLGARLRSALQLRLLSRDGIKQALVEDTWDRLTEAEKDVVSGTAGRLAFDIFYERVLELGRTGHGVIAETAFHHGVSESRLRPALELFDVVLLYCSAPEELLRRRWLDRAHAGLSHEALRARRDVLDIREGSQDWSMYGPLELPAPTILVETDRPVDLVDLTTRINAARHGQNLELVGEHGDPNIVSPIISPRSGIETEILEPPYTDERGFIQQLTNGQFANAHLVKSKASAVRGSHYHIKESHALYLISGRMLLLWRPAGSKDRPSRLELTPTTLTTVHAGVEHETVAITDALVLGLSSTPRHHESYEDDTVRVAPLSGAP